jgi:hypothetical protein
MFDTNKLTSDTWTEDDLGIGQAGDVGGDTQASDALSRRFAQKIDGTNEYVILDFAGYIAIDDLNGDANNLDQPHGITVMVSYDHVTDPNDMDTSTYSDIRYWDHQEDERTITHRDRIENLTVEDLHEAVNQMGV